MGVETYAFMAFLQEVADAVIVPRFRALASGEVHEKRPGDLVTIADREAETLITARLREAYPGAVVLGEEACSADPSLLDAYLAADHAFTVDPVDGTKNFVNHSPDHAVMVAEVRSGVTVRAWIWQPAHGVAWIAERGAGTTRDGVRMHRSGPAADAGLRGVTSQRDLVGRSPDGLEPMALTWICCGVDYARLIEGEADYVVYARGLAWDHVPGGLLLTEAGGAMAFRTGEPWTPQAVGGGLVAAADRDTLARVLPALRGLTPTMSPA